LRQEYLPDAVRVGADGRADVVGESFGWATTAGGLGVAGAAAFASFHR
jgi:hypothetical protein